MKGYDIKTFDKKLNKLSEGWKLLFDKETRLIRPKDTKGNLVYIYIHA